MFYVISQEIKDESVRDVFLAQKIKPFKHIKYYRQVKYAFGIAMDHTLVFHKNTPHWIKKNLKSIHLTEKLSAMLE